MGSNGGMEDIEQETHGPATQAIPAIDPRRGEVTYEQSPVDVLRTAIALGLLVIVLVLEYFFGETFVQFVYDLFRGLEAVPSWIITTLVLVTRIATTVLFFVGLGAAVWFRRWRLLVSALAAIVLAGLIFIFVDEQLAETRQSIVDVTEVVGPFDHEEFPTGLGVAVVTALAAVTTPWLSQNWKRAAWALVVATALCRFFTSDVSLDTVSALLTGWFTGSLALVAFGGPVRRASDAEVAEGLSAVGVELVELKKASVDARGSTPYFGHTADGTRLFVKALGEDERSADLMFRAYRKVSPHDLGDERNFSSLRRTVEHEALVALAARDVGVHTPRFLAFAHVEPKGFVLAYEAIEGSSLDSVEELTDDVLLQVWQQVALMRHHRIAHRDLRLANVFLGADGQVWMIDFGFSEIAASDLLLATDLAELLASQSLVVGIDRTIAAGVATVGAEALATAVPRLRPFALSGATRTAMKERDGLLDELRDRVAALA